MKVLEYAYENEVKPNIGGPNGYIYHMISGFENKEIDFCLLKSDKPPVKHKNKVNIIKSFLKIFYERKKISRLKKGLDDIDNINQYDVIHFHRTLDLYSHKKALENFKGKIVLTTHGPVPSHYELYNNYFTKLMKVFGGKSLLKSYGKMTSEAFYMADYIVFPCKNADDAYFELWSDYKKIYEDNKSKYVYLLTGCANKKIEISKEEMRKNHGWANDFIACFVGRHNYSKGYDILKEIADNFLKNNDAKFVICGRLGKISPLKNTNWIEIGFTDKANSYINMSDCFILPNRSTYFDLVMLEVLSIGQIVVASRTGGNKLFETFDDIGVFLYDTIEEANEILNKIKNMSKDEKERLRNNNKKLYDRLFNQKCFSERYNSFYLDILNNNVKSNY